MSMNTDHRSGEGNRWVPDGVRHDLTWDERIRRHRQAHIPSTYATWLPDITPEPPVVQIRPSTRVAFDPVRPGLMRLYAARIAHADQERKPLREVRDGERLLVGEFAGDGTAVRTMALVGQVQPVGRGLEVHYHQVYPVLNLRYRRLRCGGKPPWSPADTSVMAWPVPDSGPARVGSTLGEWLTGNVYHPRLGGSIRLLVTACAALLIMIGAASTSLA